MPVPTTIDDVEQLEDVLSCPSPHCYTTLADIEGDVLILGAGGKMGPTLTRMVRRTVESIRPARRVIAVSRFSDAAVRERLEALGIHVLSGDLLRRTFIQSLPIAPNIIYLAGTKFGTSGNEASTWATNTFLPGMIAEHFGSSRIVALSTGNIYGLSRVESGGSRESDVPNPVGEYAMSCLGRERIFEYFSHTTNLPVSIIRLNYANELRYGVLVDIARQVQQKIPIDVSMGHVNIIWQGDANAAVISALASATSPPTILNVTGREMLSVREVATRFGELLGLPVTLVGDEPETALLSDPSLAYSTFGPPQVTTDQMIYWIVDWIRRGGDWLGKPTHFSSRDGKF